MNMKMMRPPLKNYIQKLKLNRYEFAIQNEEEVFKFIVIISDATCVEQSN
ncbi:hypothetical protein Hanom_Chr09g00830851 [Helianthus anomalus]